MSSCLTIVNLALRKIGQLASGREARAVDRDDAFAALTAMYRAWINSGAFGRLSDVTPTADYVAGENERIFRNSDATLEITLPETVDDDGRMLTPLDTSVVVIVDAFSGTVTEFIYDGQIKAWVLLYDLAITDEAPLSRRDEQGLAACLAVAIVDEFGGELGPSTMQQAAHFKQALTTRYSMPATQTIGEYY